MTDALTPEPPARVRGRPFETGRSSNPLGRRVGCRNRTTITAAAVVDTFVRAIETSDFERRLRQVEADHFDHPGAAAGINGTGANGYHYNP